MDAAGIPSVHMAWREGTAPELPWCVFYIEDTDGVFADNSITVSSTKWVVELYQRQSKQDVEDAVEAAILSAFGPFTKSEAWVEKENCIQTSYYFKEIANG